MATCGSVYWNEISPAIFGAMFQNAMDPKKRREVGAHYTSEANILKLIKPLFLDSLVQEFEDIKLLKNEKIKNQKLYALQDKIASLKFLDPACGCGNFLIITYRELRRLENAILKETLTSALLLQEFGTKVSINQFYGIEIEDWPAEIAHLSMWLMQHVMNQESSELLGKDIPSIPLKESSTIVCNNSLTINWEDVISPHECSYIIGNPPFGGAVTINSEQKQWLKDLYPQKYKVNRADFVTAWFVKASNYMLLNSNIKTAFVATNSICQGQQVAILWGLLIKQGIIINFAYTSFKWTNSAKDKAGITCIIIGFSYVNNVSKIIYKQRDDNSIVGYRVNNISPYLIDEPSNTIIPSCSNAISAPLPIMFGNMPNDDGNLLLSYEEALDLKERYPGIDKFIKFFKGSDEIINGKTRCCFWLKDEDRDKWSAYDVINERLNRCKIYRLKSTRSNTLKLAQKPWLFEGSLNPKSALVIPGVSSERRKYIPIDFIDDKTIISNAAFIIPNADFLTLSLMLSYMHMVWMKLTSGRLKTDYRYSKDMIYNTFVWPELDDSVKRKLMEVARDIYTCRCLHRKSLAELYDPETMPDDLRDLHIKNDDLVEQAYRAEPFVDDDDRLSFLINLYNKKINDNSKDGK